MTQSRTSSFIEAVVGTAIGFAVSIVAGLIVYPLYGHTFSLAEVTGITLIFTLLSVVRGYVVRRGFNWLHKHGWLR